MKKQRLFIIAFATILAIVIIAAAFKIIIHKNALKTGEAPEPEVQEQIWVDDSPSQI